MSRPPNSTHRSQQSQSVPSSQSIPLRDLGRQNDDQHDGESRSQEGPGAQATHDSLPAANTGLPSITTYWDGFNPPQQQQHHGQHDVDDEISPGSPIDVSALQFALPPDINPPGPDLPPGTSASNTSTNPYAAGTPYYDETTHVDYYESDRAPLTSSAQPISGALATPQEEAQPRDSFQTVSDLGNSPSRSRKGSHLKLGFDLETGHPTKHRSYGASPTPHLRPVDMTTRCVCCFREVDVNGGERCFRAGDTWQWLRSHCNIICPGEGPKTGR